MPEVKSDAPTPDEFAARIELLDRSTVVAVTDLPLAKFAIWSYGLNIDFQTDQIRNSSGEPLTEENVRIGWKNTVFRNPDTQEVIELDMEQLVRDRMEEYRQNGDKLASFIEEVVVPQVRAGTRKTIADEMIKFAQFLGNGGQVAQQIHPNPSS